MSQNESSSNHEVQIQRALEYARKVKFQLDGGPCYMSELTPAYQRLVERSLTQVQLMLGGKLDVPEAVRQVSMWAQAEFSNHLEQVPSDIIDIVEQMLGNGRVRRQLDAAARMAQAPLHPAGRGRNRQRPMIVATH